EISTGRDRTLAEAQESRSLPPRSSAHKRAREENGHVPVELAGDREIVAAVAVEVAGDEPARNGAGILRRLLLERAVLARREDRQRVAEHVDRGDVGTSVAVQVRREHRDRERARTERSAL